MPEAPDTHSTATTPALPQPGTEQLRHIVEPLDHYNGYQWTPAVLPNNFYFFTREHASQMVMKGLSYGIHDRYELVVIYEGSGSICIEGEVFRVGPADAILMGPGMFHAYFGFEPEQFKWLMFNATSIGEAASRLQRGFLPVRLTEEDMTDLGHAVRGYIRKNKSNAELFRIALQLGSLFENIFNRELLEPVATLEQPEYSGWQILRRISHFINRRMEEAVRISDLALYLDMSESHLRKIFREHTGTSLGAWMRNSRFSRSIQLISSSTLSISEIAKLSGFETIDSFSQAFNRHIGMPPTAYRKYLAEGGQPISSNPDTDKDGTP